MIPCRNEARSIGPLLDALAGQTLQPTEILIVDDHSTDDSVAVAGGWQRDHPGVALRVMIGPGRGPGPAMNAGITATTTDILIRLDGHCVPDHDYVEQSIRALEDSNVGMAGGTWRVCAGADTPVARAIARSADAGFAPTLRHRAAPGFSSQLHRVAAEMRPRAEKLPLLENTR